MSASLVGSEMCIRDSGKAAGAAGAPRAAGAVCSPDSPYAPCTTRTAGPVSYTHLTLPTICSV
eukprot:3122855-Alexandrium_andersonii.AAC.1